MIGKNTIYDYIIIGGGPAGSTMATLLSRKDYDVLLLEKEKFPRYHVGESMLTESFSFFEDLGVLSEMKKRFVRKPGVVFSNHNGQSYSSWPFSEVIKDDSHLSFHVRRAEFDQLLLDNSRKHNAEVWEEARVLGVELIDQNQVFVNGTHRTEGEFQVKGKFLIDATGQDSLLARKFNSKKYFNKIKQRVALNAYWQNVHWEDDLKRGDLKIVALDIKGGAWMWMIPLDNDILSIGVVVDSEYYNEKRKMVRAEQGKDWAIKLYKEIVFSSAISNVVLSKAHISKEVSIYSDYSYRNTSKFGLNYATIGDASAFIDPIFSSGVYLALKSAYLLAEAIILEDPILRTKTMQSIYEKIDGAYNVVEEMVLNYYDSESLKVDQMKDVINSNYEKQRTALQIFHLLISGKFFDHPKKYLRTVKMLRDPKNLNKYENFIESKRGSL